MSTAVGIEIKKAPFPLNYSDTPLNILNAFILRSYGRLTNVLLGTRNAAPQLSDVGAWLPPHPDDAWHYWNRLAGENQPLPITPINSGFRVLTQATPTAARTVTFPQNPSSDVGLGYGSSNTVAMLENLYVPRGTSIQETLTTNTVILDGRAAETYLFKLHQASDVLLSNVPIGKKLDIVVIDEGGGNALTWAGSPGIQWPGGSAPSMPTSTTGQVVMARYVIWNVNGVVIGYQLNYTPGVPVSSYTVPAIPRNYGGGGGSPRGATKVLIQ